MEINRELRNVIATGKVYIGISQAKKYQKDVKLIIVSNNCPEKGFDPKKVYKFKGNNVELGAACGKPFTISTISIVDAGKSNILLLKKEI